MIESPGSPWQSMPLDELSSYIHEGKNEKRHKAIVELLHRLQTEKNNEGELWKVLFEEYKTNIEKWYRKYLQKHGIRRENYHDRIYEKISEDDYDTFSSYDTQRKTFDGWFNAVLLSYASDIEEEVASRNEKKVTKTAKKIGNYEKNPNKEIGTINEIGKKEKYRRIKGLIDKAKKEGKIGEKEIEAFELTEIDGYTQEEAAEKVGCSRRTIHNRKEKFIEKVRELTDIPVTSDSS